jgi:Arc/MetJ-type ribon-helix-helix transcriptional regulator
MQKQKRKLKFWNIPVTAQLNECVKKAVQINAYVSKSDFVRDAVRRRLEEIGFRQVFEDMNNK